MKIDEVGKYVRLRRPGAQVLKGFIPNRKLSYDYYKLLEFLLVNLRIGRDRESCYRI